MLITLFQCIHYLQSYNAVACLYYINKINLCVGTVYYIIKVISSGLFIAFPTFVHFKKAAIKKAAYPSYSTT